MSISLRYDSNADHAAALLDAAADTLHREDVSCGELAAARGTGYAVLAAAERLGHLTDRVAAGPGWVDGELAAVRGELVRVDAKCGVLTAIATGAAAFAGTQLHAAVPARVVLAVAVAVFAASVVVLLLALRPRTGRGGWCLYRSMTAPDIAALETESGARPLAAADLAILSRLAGGKYRLVRVAVDLIAAGTVLMAAGMLASAVIA